MFTNYAANHLHNNIGLMELINLDSSHEILIFSSKGKVLNHGCAYCDPQYCIELLSNMINLTLIVIAFYLWKHENS